MTALGATSAFCVGFLLLGTGLRGFNLLVFYQIATSATKYKKDYKTKLDGTIAATGSIARGPSQVLACSLLAVILSLAHAIYCGSERSINFEEDRLASSLTCGVIAHHATSLADTLASELGILSKSKPFFITKPWIHVPSGTNGGVTAMGFFWSAAGGFIIGISTILFDLLSENLPVNAPSVLLFSTISGLLGSILDSFLGATIQQTYWDPDTKMVYQAEDDKPASAKAITGANIINNEQVNMVSITATTAIGGWVLGPLIFGS